MRQITVGIPVFNAMPYLPESLESILRQNYNDFDILVVNDGSTDGSTEYLHSVRDSRLRVVDQENRGLSGTLNRMLAEVDTPWLARHDADDVAYPQRLASVIQYIDRHPDSGMFYSLADYYPDASIGRFRTTRNTPKGLRELVQRGHLLAICHPTVVLNVERTVAVGGYRFDLYVEDLDLWWRMALAYDIHFIPEILAGVRQNLQSTCSVNLEKQAMNLLYIQYLLISHLWKRKPLAYEEAHGPLFLLFDQSKVTFRNHLRAFNIELGRGNKDKALVQAARAFFASPKNFVSRLWDECFPDRAITMGESPKLFKKYENILWPYLEAEQAPNTQCSDSTQSRPLSSTNNTCSATDHS